MVKPAPISTIAASISGSASSIWNQTRCWRAEKPARSSRAMKAGRSQIGIGRRRAETVADLVAGQVRGRPQRRLSALGRAVRGCRSESKRQGLASASLPRAGDERRLGRLDPVAAACRRATKRRRSTPNRCVPSRLARLARITVWPVVVALAQPQPLAADRQRRSLRAASSGRQPSRIASSWRRRWG